MRRGSVTARNLTSKIVEPRIAEGEWSAGKPCAVDVHQALTHDALGGLVFLQFAALGIARVRTELAVAYADHNVFGVDFRMTRDHQFIKAAARKFGAYFSKPGTGICHQVHLERFAAPGKILIGSDSHTPTAGGVGMVGVGAGGLDVTMAMAGSPWRLTVPKVVAVNLTGRLREWASAKDVILEMLRRLSVKGGVGKLFEFTGPGVHSLTVPERAIITNMCTELGATSGLFPSDEVTFDYLQRVGRGNDWVPLAADEGADYDEAMDLDLGQIEPLVACPSMPDKVVSVRDLDGVAVDQVLVGSCTNGSYVDLRQVAEIVSGRSVHPDVELVINPSSQHSLKLLADDDLVGPLVAAGASLSEATCGPCIGLTHQPAPGMVSLRTFNRNFAGRSGLKEDAVYLCSPYVAAVAAVTGCLRDPRDWSASEGGVDAPVVTLPKDFGLSDSQILPPASEKEALNIALPIAADMKGVPDLEPLPEDFSLTVAGVFGDDVTTDDIAPASSEALATMTNLTIMSSFTFTRIDEDFVQRATEAGSSIVVAGHNYGQGSSRENAALAPRHLGVRVVLAYSFARIHRLNLINWGVVPLLLNPDADASALEVGENIHLIGFKQWLIKTGSVALGEISSAFTAKRSTGGSIELRHDFSKRELLLVLAGGLLSESSSAAGSYV